MSYAQMTNDELADRLDQLLMGEAVWSEDHIVAEAARRLRSAPRQSLTASPSMGDMFINRSRR